MTPIRLAILDCDPLTPAICKKYGSYGGVVTNWLEAGAKGLGLDFSELEISIWNVIEKNEYPRGSDIDALIITGSRVSAYEDIPWVRDLTTFTKQVLEDGRVKVAGLCFGHQIVARALNADIIKGSQGWEVSVCDVGLSSRGEELFGKDTLVIHQMHKDTVVSYPEGVEALGTSPLCEVQGMYVPNRLISLQGHPEFNEEIMLELLDARSELGIHDDTVYENALQRARNNHDGALVAKVILHCLLSN